MTARREHIPGVKITQFGKFKVYMIPENAMPPELPTGRPPLTEEEKAARAKKGTASAQASLFEPATTAKPARKPRSKKATKKAKRK